MQRFQLDCDWGQTSHLAMVFTATWSEKTFDCILVYLRDAFFEEKIKLPDWIWIKFLSKCFKRFIYLFFFRVNFKNLTIEFYIPYVLNIKFCLNRMLFTCTTKMLISTSAIPAKGYLLVMVQDDSMGKSLQQPFFYL